MATPGGKQSITVLEEAGIYQLIFGSKLPNAEQFQDWVFEEVLPSIRKTGSYNLPEKKRAISYYTDRIMLLPSSLEQNPDYWTVIEESGHLLLDVERLGYPVEQFDLLDGSVGKRWSNYRKLNNLGSKTITLLYKFDDCRGKVKVNGYPYSELGEFKFWLKNVYTPKLLPKYLEMKYTGIVLSN